VLNLRSSLAALTYGDHWGFETLPSLYTPPVAQAGRARKRAAFWRALGFPNLVRARAAKARKREERIKRETLELARRANPFALPEDAELWASVARRNVRAPGYKADSLALPRKKTPKGY